MTSGEMRSNEKRFAAMQKNQKSVSKFQHNPVHANKRDDGHSDAKMYGTSNSKLSHKITSPDRSKEDAEEEGKEQMMMTTKSLEFQYNSEHEATLQNLLQMSNTLGYSQMQIKCLKEKQKVLERAEKRLY